MSNSDFQEINDIEDELKRVDQEKQNLNNKKKNLQSRRNNLTKELETLKGWIWRTDDPNIVELRRQLLAAARLIYDENEDVELDEDEDEIDPFFIQKAARPQKKYKNYDDLIREIDPYYNKFKF